MATSSFLPFPEQFAPPEIVQVPAALRRDEGPAHKLTFAHLDDHDQPHLLAADAEPLDVAFFQLHPACGCMFLKVHPDFIRSSQHFGDERQERASVGIHMQERFHRKPDHRAVRRSKEGRIRTDHLFQHRPELVHRGGLFGKFGFGRVRGKRFRAAQRPPAFP